jgi:threonine dehydrogenase-like Zn-dependent dehydrogenase
VKSAPDVPRTATMRSAVLAAPGRIDIVAAPIPVPGPGEVRIRLEGSGVCASNLAPWGGQPWFDYPFAPGAPGHEGWGVVDALGEGVEAPTVGERVAFLSSHAYAEYDVARADETVGLPAELEGSPFPGEPLGCAFNIFRRTGVEAGQTVAIVGVGFLGAILTRLCAEAGARVVGLSRRWHAREVALGMGAETALPLDDRRAVLDRVEELTDGALCDRVIEATGKQAPLDLAGELTRVRGRLVIAGYHQGGPRRVNMQLWNWRGLDVVNAHERDPAIYLQGMREAVAAVAVGRLDPRGLYTEYPLDQLGDALETTEHRPGGFMKALIRVDG